MKLKYSGGLGIRDARNANIAQLVKLGGRMVTWVNTVWARVLHSKYVKSANIL